MGPDSSLLVDPAVRNTRIGIAPEDVENFFDSN
jgi:hypothetical protein